MASLVPVDIEKDGATEDEGEIRCICGFPDDDGFTIQCDRCFVWQHAICVNITANTVPEQYLCEDCDPRWLDVEVSLLSSLMASVLSMFCAHATLALQVVIACHFSL